MGADPVDFTDSEVIKDKLEVLNVRLEKIEKCLEEIKPVVDDIVKYLGRGF